MRSPIEHKPRSHSHEPWTEEDLAKAPLMMRIEHVALVLDIGVSTIRHQLKAGHFLGPPPVASRPYRWHKQTVIAYVRALEQRALAAMPLPQAIQVHDDDAPRPRTKVS